jgi:hypothetical protein
LFLLLGGKPFFGFGGIFGVWLLTLPALVSDPWDGTRYTTPRLKSLAAASSACRARA